MAESPSHKFGQIIGNLLEDIFLPVLNDFCRERRLYLDYQGPRPGARKGKKVTWEDRYGNNHDLDFVIEKDGSKENRGRPVAFIEAAWRRYTKHSRNKVQEIQGALLPIAEKYKWDKPFLGVVLAGEFTQGSLDQLNSMGFKILYFPYDAIVAAFNKLGLDVRFDEQTSDKVFEKCIRKINRLKDNDWQKLKSHLLKSKKDLFDGFLDELKEGLDRVIDKVVVIALFGKERDFTSISDAMRFINEYDETNNAGEFRRYEIIVKYSNGDNIDASLSRKVDVEKFLSYIGK